MLPGSRLGHGQSIFVVDITACRVGAVKLAITDIAGVGAFGNELVNQMCTFDLRRTVSISCRLFSLDQLEISVSH